MTEHSGPVAVAEVAEVATAFLQGLLGALGAEAQVAWEEADEDILEVAVTGEDLGLLIGHRGQTLAAVQDLTRTVVQRRIAAQHGRVMVDVGSYRRRRREALARFAREVAENVLASGVAVVLEPMSPSDRKVVHDTLGQVDGVSTSSEGEDPNRRVVISLEPRGA